MTAKLSLAGAPIVVDKRKTINVRIRGGYAGTSSQRLIGKKDILTLDMAKQGEADIRYLLRHITIVESEIQLRGNNPPTRIVVDNREGKVLHLVERKTEVTYGTELDMQMIKFVQRSLMSAIKTEAVTDEHKALGSMAYWEWMYVDDPRKSKVAVPIPNIAKLKSLRIGGYLLLKPKSTKVGVANMYATRADAGWPAGKWNSAGRAVGGRGFMSKAIDKLKRSNLLKNYTMHVVFTSRFAIPGEEYRQTAANGPMTPVLIVRVKRNRKYRRIR